MLMFGGPTARKQHVMHGIIVSFQYVNEEPAMVLWPESPIMQASAGAFVICLSAAWNYQEHEHLVQQAAVAAQHMGFGTDYKQVYRVASVINNYLEDLVKMQPEPEEKQDAIGEGVLLTGDGQKITFDIPAMPESLTEH